MEDFFILWNMQIKKLYKYKKDCRKLFKTFWDNKNNESEVL